MKPLFKLAGYVAGAIVVSPFVYGVYLYGKAFEYALRNPLKTCAGLALAGSLTYAAACTDLPQRFKQENTIEHVIEESRGLDLEDLLLGAGLGAASALGATYVFGRRPASPHSLPARRSSSSSRGRIIR